MLVHLQHFSSSWMTCLSCASASCSVTFTPGLCIFYSQHSWGEPDCPSLSAPKHHLWAGSCCQALLTAVEWMAWEMMSETPPQVAVLKVAALVAAWWGRGAPQGAGTGFKEGGCEEPEPVARSSCAVGVKHHLRGVTRLK